ncbi:hypothetical protein MTR67_034719, partial [Solanum verrucosum]
KNFSSIAAHLIRLTKKEVTFEWTEKFEEIFQKLKTFLTTTQFMRYWWKIRILLFTVTLHIRVWVWY